MALLLGGRGIWERCRIEIGVRRRAIDPTARIGGAAGRDCVRFSSRGRRIEILRIQKARIYYHRGSAQAKPRCTIPKSCCVSDQSHTFLATVDSLPTLQFLRY